MSTETSPFRAWPTISQGSSRRSNLFAMVVRNREPQKMWREVSSKPSFAVAETIRILSGFTEEQVPTPAHKAVMSFVEAVTDSDSVAPSVVPIGGGEVSLNWIVGTSSIQVEICGTGLIYVWSIDSSKRIFCTESDDGADVHGGNPGAIAHVRALLKIMSRDASRLNPGWRSQLLAR